MLKKFSKYLLIIISVILITTGCSKKLNIIETKDDLNNKNIGVYTGSEYDTIAQDNIENPKILYYNSYSDQISALNSGKIDGFLTDEPLAKEIIKENKDLRILKEKLTEDSYAFAINPSKSNLQDEINKELVKMNKNGKLKIFEDKWMGNVESKKELEVYHYDDSKGVVKFATVSGSAPFAYMKNNKIVGYDIDVISYICKELGYKLEVIEMSFEGIIPALKSGKVDIAGCSIIVTEERKKSVLFSEPDYTGGIVVVVRGKNEKQN